MKKIFIILLTCFLIMICVIPQNVNAALNYVNIDTLRTTLTYSNCTGYVQVFVSALDSSAETSVSARLYVKATSGKWIEVTPDWDTQTATGDSNNFLFSFDGTQGARYKVDVSVSVTIDGYTETDTDTVEGSCF